MLHKITIVAALALAGCARDPGSFPPPTQRIPAGGEDPGTLSASFSLGDATANDYLVKDIGTENSEWRWALVHPEFKLRVKEIRGVKFWMEFAVPPVTFRVTGPIVLSCSVNGHPIGKYNVSEPGRHRFEKPVPAEWLKLDTDATITAEVDKRWISKEDGAQLSFLFHSAGFSH